MHRGLVAGYARGPNGAGQALRYDAADTPRDAEGGPALARAKNTERAAARRRHRAARPASLGPEQADAIAIDDAALDETTPAARPAVERPRMGLPDVRGDVRALPAMFRTKRLLWVPFLLVFVGAVAWVVLRSSDAADAGLVTVLAFLVQFTLPVVFGAMTLPVLLAGFLAPRGSYLVGLLVGITQGVVMVVLLQVGIAEGIDVVANGSVLLLSAMMSGVVFGAVAGWYRRFLQQSQERQRARRVAQVSAREAKAREERREARRQAKQLPR